MSIFKTHKENFRLIEKYGLKKGTRLKLRANYSNYSKGRIIVIESIHSCYGWIKIRGTECFPQEVKKLMKLCYKIKAIELTDTEWGRIAKMIRNNACGCIYNSYVGEDIKKDMENY